MIADAVLYSGDLLGYICVLYDITCTVLYIILVQVFIFEYLFLLYCIS